MTKRVLIRLVIVIMIIMTARFFLGAPPDYTMVSVFEKVERRAHVVACSKDYDSEKAKFKGTEIYTLVNGHLILV